MESIEKTVFISYRREGGMAWALLVYKYLSENGFDVFFDFEGISSGDFEQIIIGNIQARAHFLVVLTPTTLDRCSEPGDWLRREIETAIREKRNIIPLFFDGFNFGTPSISKKLTGDLAKIKKYNGLDVPIGYFDEAMERLRSRYLNVALDGVLHPISGKLQKVVDEQKIAANAAIEQQKDAEEKVHKRTVVNNQPVLESTASRNAQKSVRKKADLLKPKNYKSGEVVNRVSKKAPETTIPINQDPREVIKRIAHSSNPDSYISCPGCGTKVKAKSLVKHFDKLHASFDTTIDGNITNLVREEIKQLARSSNPDFSVNCPICNIEVKAKNLVLHYDRVHNK